jgi:microsomal dipeptidase-like Zn-dependent dipeptidase
VRATCDNVRNLDDGQLAGVAKTGGLVGIGFWDTAVCGDDARAIARAVKHAVAVMGPDHVALGSDFDGAVTVPFDVTGLPLLVDALLAEGLAEEDIARVMGGNEARLLRGALP